MRTTPFNSSLIYVLTLYQRGNNPSTYLKRGIKAIEGEGMRGSRLYLIYVLAPTREGTSPTIIYLLKDKDLSIKGEGTSYLFQKKL